MDYYILFNLNQWISPSSYSYVRIKSRADTKIIYFQPNKISE
jgi:hypothetical protein